MALPKYANRPQTQGRRNGTAVRGTTKPPANPLGRLVITSTVTHGTGPSSSKNGGTQVTHWLPKEGTSWTCSDCGRVFVRDDDARGVPWRLSEAA